MSDGRFVSTLSQPPYIPSGKLVDSVMPSLNEKHTDFKLTFEIAIIEHLGLNLYSEVHSAISELLANAYDAEATEVNIEIPVGIQLGLEGQKIVISDNGHGMTYQECRDNFLKIGRNRRRQSRRSRNGSRIVIGKKGIGKLAGFGIANQVRVCTVANYKETEFLLNLQAIQRAEPKKFSDESSQEGLVTTDEYEADITREYKPNLLKVEQEVEEKQGTIVTLEKIRPLDAIDLKEFINLLARKFAIFGGDFVVNLIETGSGHKTRIEKFDVPTQFRFPKENWGKEEIHTPTMGKQEVEYWIGFTKATIKEDSVRGISVIANGKSVQDPFDFKLSGGTEGQFGLQYMTGEVKAHWLDEHSVDVIASDRASVRWSDPDASKLLLWGRQKVKDSLKDWVKSRAEETVKEITDEAPDIKKEIDSYQGEAREELKRVIERVVSNIAHVGPTRTREVVVSIVNSYRHDHIRIVLNKIIAGKGGIDMFAEALRQWDLIDAVLTFQELSVKLSAIRTLHILVLGKATEVRSKSGDLSLHEHLAAHPWLIDPMFTGMEHERNIDKFILERYNLNAAQGNEGKRFDFILTYSSEKVRIVEIKSAKDPIDVRGMTNLTYYHQRIKKAEGKQNKPRSVKTLLVYNGNATGDADGMLDSLNDEYEVYTWDDLFARNSTIYKEQLKRVREKNPDDPRIKNLWDVMRLRLEGVSDSLGSAESN